MVTSTQQGHGIEGAAMGHPNLSLGLGLRDFFAGNNFRDLPERLCIRKYQFSRGFVPGGPGVFMFGCQKQILSSCIHNPLIFLLCLCSPLSTGLLEARISKLHCPLSSGSVLIVLAPWSDANLVRYKLNLIYK